MVHCHSTNLQSINGTGSDNILIVEVIVAMKNGQVLFLQEVLKIYIQPDLW